MRLLSNWCYFLAHSGKISIFIFSKQKAISFAWWLFLLFVSLPVCSNKNNQCLLWTFYGRQFCHLKSLWLEMVRVTNLLNVFLSHFTVRSLEFEVMIFPSPPLPLRFKSVASPLFRMGGKINEKWKMKSEKYKLVYL